MLRIPFKYGIKLSYHYAIQFQQIKKTKSLLTINIPVKTVMKDLPSFDIQLKYLQSEWINLINNMVEQKQINDETQIILEQFNENGNLLFIQPDQDLRLFTNILQLSKDNNISLNLEEKRWFFTILNQNNRIIPIFLAYLKNQPQEKIIKFIENSGLCKPNTQTLILFQIESLMISSRLNAIIFQNLPQIILIDRIPILSRLKILYKKSGKLQQNALKFLEQNITILNNSKNGDWIMNEKQILSLTNDLGGFVKQGDDRLNQLLKQLCQKIVKLNSAQHNKFLVELFIILRGKNLLNNIDFISNEVKDQSLKMDLSIFVKINDFEKYFEDISFIDFYNCLQNKSTEDRLFFLLQFDAEQLQLLRNIYSINDKLASVDLSQTYLQLLAEFDSEPQLQLARVEQVVKSLKRIDPFIFYSMFQIQVKTQNSNLFENVKVEDLLDNYKQIVFVMNRICDNYPQFLAQEVILNQITQQIVLSIHLCDQEDLQRVLYIIRKIPLSNKEFTVISPALVRGLQAKLSQIKSQNKLVSMLYCLSTLKRLYQFEDLGILHLFDQKISQIPEELSSKNLFLLHKTLQFIKGLPILESRLKHQINDGRLDEFLPGRINYAATQIKLSQSYLPHEQSVKEIVDQLQVLDEAMINIELLQEYSNLLLKIEKHGKLDQRYLDIHKKFMNTLGDVDYTHKSHVIQACLLYDAALILNSIDVNRIKAFELLTIFKFLVQSQQYENKHYLAINKEILQRDDLFKDITTKDQTDKGLLSLSFFIASLDQNSELLQGLCLKYENEFESLIEEINKSNLLQNKQKEYNMDMYDSLSVMNVLQLYEGAIFSSQIHNYSNKIIDKILDLKQLVVGLNTKPQKFKETSFETEVSQLLREVFPNEKMMKEFNEIEPFRIDIYIPGKKIGIECDGHQHMIIGQLKRSNEMRNQVIERLGVKIISIFIDKWRSWSREEKISHLKVLCI